MKSLFILIATLTSITPTVSYTMLKKVTNFRLLQRLKDLLHCKQTFSSLSPVEMTQQGDDSKTKSVLPDEQSKIANLQATTAPADPKSQNSIIATLLLKQNREEETDES